MLSEAMRPLSGIYLALFLLYITFSIYALANVVTGTSSVKQVAVRSWDALVRMCQVSSLKMLATPAREIGSM